MQERDDKYLQHFRSYYETNVPALAAFARRFVSSDMSEDIIHDVFLEMWEDLSSSGRLPSRSFLFMAVRNRCLNSLKRDEVRDNYISYMQKENRRLELDFYDSFEKLLIEKEGIKAVYDQIELLPDKCRQIVKFAYFEEKKNAEIAEALGLSIRTVEHQLYLGLRTLRDKLKPKKNNKRKFFIFF